MALPLIGLTVLTGYLLSNNDETPNKQMNSEPRNSIIPNDLPNGKNIYASNYANEADFTVLQKGLHNYKDAQDPAMTGVLPPLFNTYSINGNLDVLNKNQNILNKSQQFPTSTLNSSQMNNVNEINKRSNIFKTSAPSISNRPMFNPVISSSEDINVDSQSSLLSKEPQSVNPLTGIPYENVHQNMVPFFGGSLKQNVEKLTNTTRLDLYTGSNDTFKHKKEAGPFYTLQKQDIHGTPNISENTDMSRFIPSNYKQNEKPFYEEKVSAPIAGTVNNKIRNIPKNVDELRYASKPKLSFEGRTIAGQFGNVRGQQAKVNKNLVDTYYENTPDRWLKTKGALTGETQRENYDMKKTVREVTSEESYYGPVFASDQAKSSQRKVSADSVNKNNTHDSIVKETNRQSFLNDFVRNVDSVKKSDATDDFGKKGYNPKFTERFINGETNQFKLNVNMQNRGQQLKHADEAKPTIKQTTLYSNNNGNIKSVLGKGTMEAVHNGVQHWNAKTTNKELLVNNKYVGSAKNDKGMGYNVANYEAKTTGKEIITNKSKYIGGSSVINKNVVSRNNYNNAEINDKQEILISNSRSNGPQAFQISAGADIQGDLKYTDRMALKEEVSYRKQQDFNESLNNKPPGLTSSLQNIGAFENKYQTAETENTRIDPVLNKQLSNNPYYINTQGIKL